MRPTGGEGRRGRKVKGVSTPSSTTKALPVPLSPLSSPPKPQLLPLSHRVTHSPESGEEGEAAGGQRWHCDVQSPGLRAAMMHEGGGLADVRANDALLSVKETTVVAGAQTLSDGRKKSQ